MSHYIYGGMFRNTYNWHYFNYLFVSNERLEDMPANRKLAKAKVHLLFMVRMSYNFFGNQISILKMFEAPKTSIYSKP